MLRLALTPALSRKQGRGRRPTRWRAAVGDRGYSPFSRLREKVAAKLPDEGQRRLRRFVRAG